jgi:glycosyltransferase involved in cell wall biosynthesis
MPVLFFQHCKENINEIIVEQSEYSEIEIINLPRELTRDCIESIKQLLYFRGIKRPLIWIYDPVYYGGLLNDFPCGYRVFHATEDYFTETKHWGPAIQLVRPALRGLFGKIDFLVACSNGVANSCVDNGGYQGPFVISKNGCDTEFFTKQSVGSSAKKPDINLPIAIYQGGINKRLDFNLISQLARRMNNWRFYFCGIAEDSREWRSILKLPNVKYFGALEAEGVAKIMFESTVGLIPFKQDAWIKTSLPLKAYEYVACGLPVVTVPIFELEKNKVIFSTAKNAIEFESEMCAASITRNSIDHLKAREALALENSYEKLFENTISVITINLK